MPERSAINAAIDRGVAFLEAAQLESGAMPATVAHSPDMTLRPRNHLAGFISYMIAYALLDCQRARPVVESLVSFIAGERRPGDLFHYWPKGHEVNVVPVDIDDTSLASLVISAFGHKVDNRAILLANRDPKGMFYTWLTPMRRPINWHHLRRDWKQIFIRWEKSPVFSAAKQRSHDVDAGINANALAWLGPFEGDEVVIDQLLQIVRDEREGHCDRYYHDAFAIRYFFSKALVGRCPEAGEMLVARSRAPLGASPMQVALAMLVRSIWQAAPDDAMTDRLLAAQSDHGSWPIAPLFINSRPRRGYLDFGETPQDAWRAGGEALTTALAVAALDGLTTSASAQ